MSTSAVRPVPDELTQPFWDAAAERRLALQRCGNCSRVNHPPQSLCGWCGSAELSFADVPGTGWVHSHTSALRRPNAQAGPTHTNIVVELDVQDGIFLVGKVPGDRPAWLKIGAPVTVRFETLEGTDAVLPQFDPTEGTSHE